MSGDESFDIDRPPEGGTSSPEVKSLLGRLKDSTIPISSFSKKDRDILLQEYDSVTEDILVNDRLEIFKNEVLFESSLRQQQNTELDSVIKAKSTSLDPETEAYILSRAGNDQNRQETYRQAAVLSGLTPEEQTRLKISPTLIRQAEALGIPKKAPASEYLQPKGIPGLPEQKSEAAQAALGSTIPEGKRDSTTVSRIGNTFEWKDPKNPDSGSYFLDVERTPPILTKKRNGLEIRMQLSGNTEKPYKNEKAENKRLDAEKIPLEKTLEGVMSLGTKEGNNNVMPLESANPKDTNPEGKKKIISPEDIANIKLLLSLKLPAQKGFYIQTLAELQKSFTQKKGQVNEAIIKLNSKSGEMDILERMDRFSELQPKQELIENIGKTIERLEDVANKYKDIGEDEKSPLEKGIDDFERNSEFNLGYLSRIQYGQIGQKNLDLIIQSINEKNIPEVGQIDPSLNERLTDPQTQKLTLVIANLVRNNTLPDISARSNTDETIKKQDEWKDVSRTDPIIAYNQTQTPIFGEALKSVKISLDPNMVKSNGDKRSPREIIDDAITGKSPQE